MFVEDICGPDTTDDYGLHSDRHMACFSTMLWLANAGYLEYADTVRQEAIDQAVLTHKAFTLLSAPAIEQDPPHVDDDLPDAIKRVQQSNIYQLRAAIKSGSSSRISALTQGLMVQAKDFA